MKNCPPKYTAVVVDLPSIRKAKCYRKEPFHGRISNCSIVPHATFPVPLLKPKRPHIADGSRNAYSLVPEDNSSTTGKLSFTGWSHQTGMVLYTPNVKRVLSTSFPSHRCKGFPPMFLPHQQHVLPDDPPVVHVLVPVSTCPYQPMQIWAQPSED